MVVRATRVLVGRCRPMATRCAGQRQRHQHQRYRHVLAARAPNSRCPAAAKAVSTASSLPPHPSPTTSSSLSALPHSTAGPRVSVRAPSQQDQHRRLALAICRRALSLCRSTPDRVHQRQQEEDSGTIDNGTASERRSYGEGGVGPGGRVRQGASCGSGGEHPGDEGEEDQPDPKIVKESDRVWTVPNMITMGRIAFCPVLAGLIVTSQHELALAGLLGASLTDWLDGYIARRWNQKSVLGGFLDPLADKIMVTTVALALGQQGVIPTALVAVMVGRDALLIAGSLALRYKTKREGDAFFDLDSLDYKVTPSTLSKVNTVLQFGTLWLGLTNSVYLVPGDAVFSALCVGTGVATLASGVNYLLVSGLKPRGNLGKRLMVQRENLQERYREREVLVRERMGVRRERMRVRRGELNDKLKARRRKVTGALKDRMSTGRGVGQRVVEGGSGGKLKVKRGALSSDSDKPGG
ncbi:unnamed protein product [Scytosiphon promiscuus]